MEPKDYRHTVRIEWEEAPEEDKLRGGFVPADIPARGYLSRFQQAAV